MTPSLMTPSLMTPSLMTPSLMTPSLMTPCLLTLNDLSLTTLKGPSHITLNYLSQMNSNDPRLNIPNLIFAGKARGLPFERSSARCSTQAGSSLACKFLNRLGVTDNDRHCSLSPYPRYYNCKNLLVLGPML
jgi:hypothetical protein